MNQEIKVLDCTIRDGGLLNNHGFKRHFVRKLYNAVAGAGADYIELGYRNSQALFPSEKYGPFKYCEDKYLKDLTQGLDQKIRIAVMVDTGRVDANDVESASQSPLQMIRVASYVKDVAEAVELTRDFADKGYETTINIMAISRDRGPELTAALQLISTESPAHVVYVVDSFGALRPGETGELVERFKTGLPGKEVGFHGHNNMQLAFANTLEAMRHGATFVDGTVFGMGRAAGNCPLELLLGHLADTYDPALVLELIGRNVLPLRDTMEWGYIIPYALTGLLNLHPRPAMDSRNSPARDDYLSLYENLKESMGH